MFPGQVKRGVRIWGQTVKVYMRGKYQECRQYISEIVSVSQVSTLDHYQYDSPTVRLLLKKCAHMSHVIPLTPANYI